MTSRMILAALLAAAMPAAAIADSKHIDVAQSSMTVYVYKTGLFSFFADNHTIAAPIASGTIDEGAGIVHLVVDATRMRVLDPGGDHGHRDTVQANMLGPQVLDTAHYPQITFASTSIHQNTAAHWTVDGDLTLHGQTHPVVVDVTRGSPGHFEGSATVTQTDFGITPITIAGGTVKVKNDVKIQFTIVTK